MPQVSPRFPPPLVRRSGGSAGRTSTFGRAAGDASRRATTTGTTATSGAATGTTGLHGTSSGSTTVTGTATGAVARYGVVARTTRTPRPRISGRRAHPRQAHDDELLLLNLI